MPLQNENIRSEVTTELINANPGWLIRRGISVFFFILLACGVGTYFIKYPDVVNANAVIVPVNAPKPLVTKTSGKLIKLLKTEGANCNCGDLICFLESTAKHEEVMQLSYLTDSLQQLTDDNSIEKIPILFSKSQNSFTQLGELQGDYRSFAESFLNFTNYLNNGYYVKKKIMLQQDLLNTKRLYSNLIQQKGLQQKDLNLIQKTHDAQQLLKNEKVISEYDMRNEESKLINKEMSIPQINASLIGNQGQQNTLLKEMMELDNQIVQQKKIFVQALNSFKSSIEEWKVKYILTAPVNGTVSFTGFLQENQQVENGKTVCFIIPANTEYFCEVLLPQNNFGKIKPGQEVLLKFQSYPYQEFGSVKGLIDVIKNIPTDSGYLSKVNMPMGLLTNYNKQLVFTNGLRAQAEIITEDMRLSDRLLNGVRQIFKRN
jgi:multidrug efflux pump subunit AcrA (membrane-fusion protein)